MKVEVKKLLVICLLVLATGSQAQDRVVTIRNDTLPGRARILWFESIDKIEFSGPDGNEKRHFTSMQVREVRVGNDVYHPANTFEGCRMLKLVQSGTIGLYLGRGPSDSRYQIQYLVKRNGTATEVPNIFFKRELSKILSDCPRVSQMIARENLGRDDIPMILREYDQCSTAEQVHTNETDLKIERTNVLIKKIRDTSFEGKADVIDALNDAVGKMKRGETIPNYLLGVVTRGLKDQPDFLRESEEILGAKK